MSLRSIQVLLADELGIRPALSTVQRWVKIAEENGEAA